MDARSLELLEFPLVRERLAALTAFPPSRRLAEGLVPASDPVLVTRGLDETDQARGLLAERPAVGIGGSHDIGPAVERASRSGRLDPTQFIEIAETLDAVARLQTSIADDRRPLIKALARDLHGQPALRSTLTRSFDPVGELLDTASPRLGGVRAAVRVAYDRLRRRLDTLVGSELGSALQEPIVTLRNGRYVVPVKAEARSRVKGIVHDASGSGQTVFIEPLVIVELGNAWREAQLAESEEIARILDELSALVGVNAAALTETLDALARFDFWAAKAQLAAELGGVRAHDADDGAVVLLGARHPGLTGRVIPIDVRLGDGYRALVVTGPNTGGKTVTLRTLGLLALMHQAGLHVPAESGSRLPIFRDVFADIGDEQSIAQSLSTFSGHLRSIIRIVAEAGPETLVLLDELGAGTDPTEGSALAQALLDHFIRAGSLVAATTHYAELKAYAHTTEAARNASVEFDLETLSPTYRLTIGLPGGSQAFAIAERLGLSAVIVDDARSRLTEAQRTFEATLSAIKTSETEAAEALDRARAADIRAQEALRAATDERRQSRSERDDAVRAARVEAERLVDALRDEIAHTRQTLERETLTAPGLDAALTRAEALVARLPAAEPDDVPSEAANEEISWQVGDRARSRRGGWDGRVAALDRDGRRATLETGGLRVVVELADLEASLTRAGADEIGDPMGLGPPSSGGSLPGGPLPGDRAASGGSSSIEAIRSTRARSVASSLDLRGARVEEALDALGRYLEDASLAGLSQVTIVHGMGTGALRDAVREEASAHPLVRSARAGERGEGGDGATIVAL